MGGQAGAGGVWAPPNIGEWSCLTLIQIAQPTPCAQPLSHAASLSRLNEPASPALSHSPPSPGPALSNAAQHTCTYTAPLPAAANAEHSVQPPSLQRGKGGPPGKQRYVCRQSGKLLVCRQAGGQAGAHVHGQAGKCLLCCYVTTISSQYVNLPPGPCNWPGVGHKATLACRSCPNR